LSRFSSLKLYISRSHIVPIIPAKTVRSKQYEIVFPEIYAKFMPLSIAGEVRNVKMKTCGTNSNLFRGPLRMKIGW